MKRFAAILFLCLSLLKLSAQHVSDNALTNSVADTARINKLNILSEQISDSGNYHKADSLAENALQLAKQINFKRGRLLHPLILLTSIGRKEIIY